MTYQKKEKLGRKDRALGDESTRVYFLNRRKTSNLKTYVCLVTIILAATLVIAPVRSQTDQLIPDYTSVTQDFFDLVPGAVNPVLTSSHVTDRVANFVADPFLFHEGNSWYMFFEVETNSGQEIGLATSSNGFDWTYQQVVLSVPSVKLSFPYVFKWEGTYYMMPDAYPAGSWLYKATNFPYTWTLVNVLISNQSFIPADSQIFRYNNEWWMFVAEWNATVGRADNLHLFYSSNLTNPSSWHEHPMSPIVVGDPSKARGGGRVVIFDSDRIIRLAQKCDVIYGEAVRAFEVDILDETHYAEHEISGSPILGPSGSGWNSFVMHHADPWWTGNSWLVAVDGGTTDWFSWSIGIYLTPLQSAVISPTQVRMDLGQTQAFGASPLGGKSPYSYQWYLNDSAVLGANSQNWTFTPTTTEHYKVYVNVTDSLNTQIKSNSVTDIIVYPSPSVSISPASASVTVGNIQQFTSAITGGVAPYTFQWYYGNNTAIVGATASTLNYKANSTGTINVYLKTTDSLSYQVNSNLATLNVYSQPTASISPVSASVTVGSVQQFTSTIAGGLVPYAYQWYYGNNTAIVGATASTLNYKANFTGAYSIYLNVTDSLSYQVKSNSAIFNVYSQLSVSISPVSASVTVGGSQQFTSTVAGGLSPYIYQWFQKAPGGSYLAVSGATSDSFSFVTSVATVTGTWSFILQVNDNLGVAVNSSVVLVTVNLPKISASAGFGGSISPSGDVSVNYNENITFSIAANTGYYIANVMVNGGSVGAVSSYTFTNVQDSYTISATFAAVSQPTSTPRPTAAPTSAPSPTDAPTATPIPTPLLSPSPTPTASQKPAELGLSDVAIFGVVGAVGIGLALGAVLVIRKMKKGKS